MRFDKSFWLAPFFKFYKWGFSAVLLLMLVSVGQLHAQTATPSPTAAPIQGNRTDGATSDYITDSLRLLFPSAPASLIISDVELPILPTDAPTFDLLPMGTLVEANPTLTKTLNLELGGGIRGRVFANPPWLYPLPDRFINPQGTGRLQILVSVRQDAAQGAGLLPGQTNWGKLLLSLNGSLLEYAVPLVVAPPPKITRDSGTLIFSLHKEILSRLDAQGDIEAFIGTPAIPNGSQFVLGLIVDYLGEDQYNQRLAQADFVNRVTETLAQKDYNNDGWVGFKPEDILVGAPGWALGRKIR